ncbi:MAG TPA: proline dehydrogenase family protein [Actinomycetota bacterium]|nr:proline dehydrogenase family protein [Actinomycetota bacterium]
MSLARNAILWAADNPWLREHLPSFRFIRRTVGRFMPGETLDAALGAAARLANDGLPTIVTELGENVATRKEAEDVADHYIDAYGTIADRGLDTEISLKPTHLGLDLDPDLAAENVERVAQGAEQRGSWLWLDMESGRYVQPTIDLFRKVRATRPNTGICLQAYLRRTPVDISDLMPDASIRLVKGAYREHENLLVGDRQAIDESYRRLALRILEVKGPSERLVLGTHDVDLVSRIEVDVESRDGFEIAMLYGIRSNDQVRLAGEGYTIRTLISYGTHWYPWFMRRIAEKPLENVLLALRNFIGR